MSTATVAFVRIDPDGPLLGYRADRWQDGEQLDEDGSVNESIVEAVRALFRPGDEIQDDDNCVVWTDFESFVKDMHGF